MGGIWADVASPATLSTDGNTASSAVVSTGQIEITHTLTKFDTLLNVAKDKPWISTRMVDSNTLEINAADLYKYDNIIDAGNKTMPGMLAIAQEIHDMIKRWEKISVAVKGYAGKYFLSSSIENYPNSDIGERVEDCCEARAHRGKQWIIDPPQNKHIDHHPIHIEKWTFVSDVKSITYTIKLEDK